jgi:hypothetical protein
MTNSNKPVSSVVKSVVGADTVADEVDSSALFGQRVIIASGNVTLNNESIDFEFDCPFDTDLEQNESEITVYNLSRDTISALKYNNVITITAGYGNDTGIIFSGRISKIKTGFDGVEKKTVIYALDDQDLEDKELQEVSYAAGTKSSYILKDLVSKMGLPIAIFQIRYDYTNKDSVKVDGKLSDIIDDYAKQCGVSVYIQKGKVYVHDVRTAGQNISFVLSEDTGLIGSPEEFEETVEEESYTETIHGYSIKMLLQHRMQAGVKVKISSRDVSGTYTVRKGEHSYNGTEMTTSIEVIA